MWLYIYIYPTCSWKSLRLGSMRPECFACFLVTDWTWSSQNYRSSVSLKREVMGSCIFLSSCVLTCIHLWLLRIVSELYEIKLNKKQHCKNGIFISWKLGDSFIHSSSKLFRFPCIVYKWQHPVVIQSWGSFFFQQIKVKKINK